MTIAIIEKNDLVHHLSALLACIRPFVLARRHAGRAVSATGDHQLCHRLGHVGWIVALDAHRRTFGGTWPPVCWSGGCSRTSCRRVAPRPARCTSPCSPFISRRSPARSVGAIIMAATFVMAGVSGAPPRLAGQRVPFYAAALASKESGAVLPGLVAANDPDPLGGVGLSHWRCSSPLTCPRTIPLSRALWRSAAAALPRLSGCQLVYGAALTPCSDTARRESSRRRSYHAPWSTGGSPRSRGARLRAAHDRAVQLRIEYSPRVIDVQRRSTCGRAGFLLIMLRACLFIYCWRRAPPFRSGSHGSRSRCRRCRTSCSRPGVGARRTDSVSAGVGAASSSGGRRRRCGAVCQEGGDG